MIQKDRKSSEYKAKYNASDFANTTVANRGNKCAKSWMTEIWKYFQVKVKLFAFEVYEIMRESFCWLTIRRNEIIYYSRDLFISALFTRIKCGYAGISKDSTSRLSHKICVHSSLYKSVHQHERDDTTWLVWQWFEHALQERRSNSVGALNLHDKTEGNWALWNNACQGYIFIPFLTLAKENKSKGTFAL